MSSTGKLVHCGLILKAQEWERKSTKERANRYGRHRTKEPETHGKLR